jgi:hypothetical protein
MTYDHAAGANAVIADVRAMLPSTEFVNRALNDPDCVDLGLNVTLPAAYLHIIVAHCEALQMQLRTAGIDPGGPAYTAWMEAMLTGQMAGAS